MEKSTKKSNIDSEFVKDSKQAFLDLPKKYIQNSEDVIAGGVTNSGTRRDFLKYMGVGLTTAILGVSCETSFSTPIKEPLEEPFEADYDVCVVGLGAGGFAAAHAAAKAGLRVVAVEPNTTPGGTGVYAFVSIWPFGPADVTSSELFESLQRIDGNGQGNAAIATQHNVINSTNMFSGLNNNGLGVNPGASYWMPENYNSAKSKVASWGSYNNDIFSPYSDTIPEEGISKTKKNTIFDGEAMGEAMKAKLESFGEKVKVYYGQKLVTVTASEDRVQAITTSEGVRITAKIFIDSTADLYLLRGIKSSLVTKTLDGPASGTGYNGTSISYKVKYTGENFNFENPFSFTENEKTINGVYVVGFPKKRFSIVPLNYVFNPFVNGDLKDYRPTVDSLTRQHWESFKKCYGMQGYEYDTAAIMAGTRQSYRAITEKIITYNDIKEGGILQDWPHRAANSNTNKNITWTTLKVDIHRVTMVDNNGEAIRLSNLPHNVHLKNIAAGVPYEAMIPQGMKNVLVACRGAGFTHTAAASIRLIRTMMGLGHAAGKASKIAITNANGGEVDVKLPDSDVYALSNSMRKAFRFENFDSYDWNEF